MDTERLSDDQAGRARAAALLRDGAHLASGAEAGNGLGGEARQGRAVAARIKGEDRSKTVAAVFDAKGRPHFNPLICHYPDASLAFAHVEPNDAALALAERFWPGPLTLVLPRRVTCPVHLLAGAGLETLAVRVPAHPAAQALLRLFGGPVPAHTTGWTG